MLYRWNIPDRYAMTMFQNVDSIIDSISNSDAWWVRRHAIEGVGLFFERTYPWVGEDIGQLWYKLKEELLHRIGEIKNVLEIATNDPDNDVKTSAVKVLQKIILLSVNDDHPFQNFSLSQNYPNPFNPSTKISWQSPVSGWQTLKVYDVLGREVVTLVNEEKPAGSYEVQFNASQLSSGIYYYQLKVEDYIQTNKMIYLK
ncbi:MAG: T9SS type A sorting domain-containing protein [Ignavibacteria bacterium]|nr:T9SS type A sorting domain-containing protein [Ignavibacteria bacterium]